MPEPTNPNPNPAGGANPPANPSVDPKAPDGSIIDISKLSEEQLNKVLEDQRLWKNPRLAGLLEDSKKAKEYEAQKAKDEQEALKKKGDFETLAKQKEEEVNGWKTKWNTTQADNAIMAEAAKNGITDLDAAKKLVDRANIKVNEDGSVTGADEAIKKLVTEKSYLVNGKPTAPTVGGGTNPGDPNGTQPKFKLSQLQDSKFYQEHLKEINDAMRIPGAIEDDLAK